MTVTIGIDEAGRGPVIGPIVLCGVSIDEKDIHKLVSLGVKDSKLLSPNVRESMFEKIKKIVKDYKIHVVGPEEVDRAVEATNFNLNWLEATHSAQIINELSGDKAILDCPSTNVPAYTEYVRRLISRKIDLVCEHKADMTYPVVSAASVLAKVVRDREVKKLEEQIGESFGSGYPADPRTKQFLEKNWDKFDFFRKSWSSWKKVKEKKGQKNLVDF
ncbi:ribonuclease HII [Candidatus Woesearchaeota archaeon CG11_big_fil_rev_8_21_14_0_20_43_8]|nr:MAG: ribonuclease HII [Candidatus Woesearchaeota archaeon CG11_big_fil_rev_8_21_14_0_20_43_8]PIO08865.1 MAG: ribonuclease HII [Candidatus Woesearchaeota archaeon CG08_land_8_20_14_0_20_43_7]